MASLSNARNTRVGYSPTRSLQRAPSFCLSHCRISPLNQALATGAGDTAIRLCWPFLLGAFKHSRLDAALHGALRPQTRAHATPAVWCCRATVRHTNGCVCSEDILSVGSDLRRGCHRRLRQGVIKPVSCSACEGARRGRPLGRGSPATFLLSALGRASACGWFPAVHPSSRLATLDAPYRPAVGGAHPAHMVPV